MASRELRRQPILEAMIHVVGTKGYQAASVGDVVAEARASRATFYKYFDGKHDCFLAAYELAADRVLGAALEGCEGAAGPWPEPARTGLAAIVELFAADPELARTAVVEVAAAGDEARRRHWSALGRLARLLDEGRHPRRPRLPPNTALMAVSGVAALIFDELRAGRAAELLNLLPELEFALLVPFVGPRAAGAEASRDASYSRSL
jgi:AcrR family transcriptional regulator